MFSGIPGGLFLIRVSEDGTATATVDCEINFGGCVGNEGACEVGYLTVRGGGEQLGEM